MTEQVYSMKKASEEAGLSSHVLRAWEKRYQAVKPLRTVGKHRLYSKEHVKRLQLLKQLTEQGYRISQIAGLTTEELQEKIEISDVFDASHHTRIGADVLDRVREIKKKCLLAIKNMSTRQLTQILNSATVELSQKQIIEQLLVPLL